MIVAVTMDLEATEATVLPDWMGERVRGALFGALKSQDADLATDTHADRSVQPYTVAWLGPRGEVRPGARGTVRWTALEAGVAQSIVTDVMPAIGETLDLSGQSWRVTARGVPPPAHEPGSRPETEVPVTGGASAASGAGSGGPGVASSPGALAPIVVMGTPRSPWAGTGTCEALARLHLIGGRRPAPRVELQFTTPTTFHSQGRSMPLPLPRLVFGSLLDRWNAFAPLRIDPEILVVVEQACTIARYDLRTEAVPLGGGLQIGFVGRCTYGLPPGRGIRPADEYAWRVLHLLANFAFFAGVGAKTTMGMGTVRMLPGR